MTSPEAIDTPGGPPPAEQPALLAKAVVGIIARCTGRGPTKVRVTIAPDLICAVMQDNHTKGERSLLEHGRHRTVGDLRRAYYDAMRSDLIAAVQDATGREVRSVLADHDPFVDVSALSFVLAAQE